MLTKKGELLLPRVEELLLKHSALKLHLAEAEQKPSGNVRLATIYSIGMYELTPFLKKFIRTYPDVHIELQYRQSEAIYDMILENKIDLGMVAYPEAHGKIKTIPFGTDRLVLIVPPNHRLAKRKRVRLRQIEGEKFIAFDRGIPTRGAIDQILEQFGIKVQIRMTYENIDTLKNAVEVGFGISIVPSKTVTEEIRKGMLRCLQLEDVKLDRPLGILISKNHTPSYPVELFIRTLTTGKV